MELSATDMELSLRLSVEAQVEGDGAVVAPGRLLVDLARLLPENEVVLEHRPEQGVLEVTCGPASYKLNTYSAEDFPKLPQPEESPGLKIPAAALEESIDLVARAASRDDMRPVLTGVFVSASAKEMTMVATDSYRLAVKRTELETDLGGELEANIPARALRELGRILSSEGAGEASISLLANQAVFQAGSILLSTRLIDGQFPNFRQLLPESYEHDVRLPRSEFLDVTRRVSQLAQRNAPLRLSFESGQLTVAAETPDVGDARETMPAVFEGEPLEIGFNPEFLKEGIESVAGEEVLVRLISPLRPGLLEPVEGQDFRYLVMPIRLNV